MFKIVIILGVLFLLSLGFIIGALLGVKTVELNDLPPRTTMFEFVLQNISLLASVSSILALVLAFGLFVTWKKQQKQILLIQQKKEILENLARLSAAFRLHIIYGAFDKAETEVFYKKLFDLLLKSMESISVYYMMAPKVKNRDCTYADLALVKQNDFLDPIKDYHSFIGDYHSSVSYGLIAYGDKVIGYNLSDDNKVVITETLFREVTPDQSGYRYMNTGEFGKKVSEQCDLAIDAIKSQLE